MGSNVKYLTKDIQSQTEGFAKLPIKKVGVRGMVAPIKILRKDNNEYFTTIANFSLYCSLDENTKGINMSRNGRTLISSLNEEPLKLNEIYKLTEDLMKAHNTEDMYLKMTFQYIFKDHSPATHLISYEPCNCTIECIMNKDVTKVYLEVASNESSCCPCSKNMSLLTNNITDEQLAFINSIQDEDLKTKILASGFGAHNQRSEIKIKVELNRDSYPDNLMWIEDLVRVCKFASSASTKNILKRPDEKMVTELQYLGGYIDENCEYHDVEGAGPKFCEDIARDAADLLNKNYLDKTIKDYVVVVENQESIHTTLTAVSVITAGRNLK